MTAAGFPKTFEIGRAYRNEGTSPEHAQEFTNLEFYWAYADYRDGMGLVKELYRLIAKEVFGTTKFSVRGHSFDLAGEWPEIDYGNEIKKQTGVDIQTASEKEMQSKLKDLKVEFDGANRERLVDSLWKYCRKKIDGPGFLVNQPIEVSPLAKKSEKIEKQVQRFQRIHQRFPKLLLFVLVLVRLRLHLQINNHALLHLVLVLTIAITIALAIALKWIHRSIHDLF